MGSASTLQLLAPISGTTLPLEKVPDRTFAEKLIGEGIAIEPSGNQIVAPCHGRIILVHPAKHSLTLRTEEGVEILLYVGLDSAIQQGEGFHPLVQGGDQVSAGTPLLQFDREQLITKLRSLLTLMLITNGEKVARYHSPDDRQVITAKAPLLKLDLRAPTDPAASTGNIEAKATLRNLLGLHARPAAHLVKEAKRYMAQIELEHNGRRLDAKSLITLLAANVQHGDELTIRAMGQDASYAVHALVSAIESGLGESLPQPKARLFENRESPLLAPQESGQNYLSGAATSTGIAIGPAHQWREPEFSGQKVEYASESKPERAKLTQAIIAIQNKLQRLIEQLSEEGLDDNAEIFSAHSELLDDPGILKLARTHIAQGKTAEYAWYDAIQQQIQQLKATESPLLMGRADDLQDIGHQVLKHLKGISDPYDSLPPQCILIAKNLTPSHIAHLDPMQVLGIVLIQGGATSHSALLARAMGIPTLAATPIEALKIPNGQNLILDGTRGQLYTSPSELELQEFQQQIGAQQEQRQQAVTDAQLPAKTQDNIRIKVVANIGNAFDAVRALNLGAEGVGLLRSEFLYMEQYAEPDEEQQAQVYMEIAETLGTNKSMVVRTLDAGGDKRLHYLPQLKENNPVLGERGIRLGLKHPAMLRRQIRAILRSCQHTDLKIMFPMVASLAEFKAAKSLVLEEAARLYASSIKIGLMVEVPSAAILAHHFAPEADFFSIGTNDLTQYTLAMDRGHPELSCQFDPLHPAVLRLIQLTVAAAKAHHKPVGICGGTASDALAIPILLGLGVTELSCSVSLLPVVKQQIRTLNLSECQELALAALEMSDATSVRRLLTNREQGYSPAPLS